MVYSGLMLHLYQDACVRISACGTSEEDKQLEEELTMLVERLQDTKSRMMRKTWEGKGYLLYKPALEQLRQQIRASTSSMTSVPKPLKFLRKHYDTLKEIYENMPAGENKRFCADVVSVLGMTMSDSRDCLKYRILGSKEDIAPGVMNMSGEIGRAWTDLEDPNTAPEKEQLLKLATEIIPYHMSHNAEAEACDLLMEMRS
ncbi:putative 26S proteasome non-ATPase regulatory subunit 2 [Apostichopus japonicus]|uniref:Putative 26S proteasome non-ATPase regulatory subunit 2 n=1 Tax=Stichopus japonicus TaxID=307972 RepID=A0A2G8LQ50_STIJA|nr:putative 26S proteasome non-ATPase regulatory subunit 2 [Apostichopus japonicus]